MLLPMVMDHITIKWIIFGALLLTVPAVLFMIQVVVFIPAIFFVAGIIGSLTKLLSGKVGETAAFIAFFGMHLLVFGAVYYGVSVLVAKAIAAIPSPSARLGVVIALVLALGALTQLPIYGAGGHQPMKWVSLSALVEPEYGPAAIPVVYVPSIAIVAALLVRRHWKLQGMA
jgi:hypothetical protein